MARDTVVRPYRSLGRNRRLFERQAPSEPCWCSFARSASRFFRRKRYTPRAAVSRAAISMAMSLRLPQSRHTKTRNPAGAGWVEACNRRNHALLISQEGTHEGAPLAKAGCCIHRPPDMGAFFGFFLGASTRRSAPYQRVTEAANAHCPCCDQQERPL